MKKLHRVIFYHIKAMLKHRSVWVVLAVALFLYLVFRGIDLPDIRNTKVGIVTNGGRYALSALQHLQEEEESIFRFVPYEKEEELTEDVRAGKLECGFVFSEGFDEDVISGNAKRDIRYINSPYTTKGEIAKEKIYRAFLRDHSTDILAKCADQLFYFNDPAEKEKILDEIEEKNRYYNKSNDIFMLDFQ